MPLSAKGITLRIGFFLVLSYVTLGISAGLLSAWVGVLLAAVLSVLLAGLAATLVVVRVYDKGNLREAGVTWRQPAWRHLALGLAGGAAAALLVVGMPLLLGKARWEPVALPASLQNTAFLALCLAIGAFGEELLFRGYLFRLLQRWGAWAAILPTSILFGAIHINNLHASTLSLVNTILWGIVIGCAAVRSGDIWMATGVHYGWNLLLPLFGVPLSGFTMGTTGRTLRWSLDDLWSGGGYGPEGGLLCLLVLPLLLLFVLQSPVLPQTPALLARTGSSKDVS